MPFKIENKNHFLTSTLSPEITLNDYLRNTAHLTGTKRMCLEGGCGCCIVAVKKYDPTMQKHRWFAINSCLVSIFSCEGWEIYTIEGIQGPNEKINELSELLAKENGSQCGYCSTGMIMNMYALKASGQILTEKLIENSFAGNICRCTGYRPILKAFKSLAVDDSWDIEDWSQCTSNNCGSCSEKNFCRGIKELQADRWIKVFSLIDIISTIRFCKDDSYILVAGNTAKALYKPLNVPKLYIDISEVKELTSFKLNEDNLEMGANISLNNVIDIFESIASKNSKFLYLKDVAKHIRLIANPPIRNIATLAGNLMTKYVHHEFPSDIFLLLETINASLLLIDVDMNKIIVSASNFLTTNMNKKVLTKIILNGFSNEFIYKFTSFKIMPRSANALALLNMGLLFKLTPDFKVETAQIVIGNISKDFIHAHKTEQLLKSKYLFNNELLLQAYSSLEQEVNPSMALSGQKFRKQLAISLFYKFVLSIAPESLISSRNKSGGSLIERPLSSGTQIFKTDTSMYPVTEPLIKLEALAQTSGKAEYSFDQPDRPNQLYGSFVLAKAPAGSQITNIDILDAEKYEGYVGFFQAKDVPGYNSFYPKGFKLGLQEEIFCSGTVLYYSQPVGLVVSESYHLSEKAAELVKVTYKNPPTKPFLYIHDVLDRNAVERTELIYKVEATRKGNDIKHIIKGEININAHSHFHMEVLCCNVIPTEDGIDIIGGTQWMDGTQFAAAQALNLPANKINVFVRRLGGAFGAKISRSCLLSTAGAVVAYKLNRPVKMWLPLQKNLRAIGKRCRTLCDYEAGVNAEGSIQYMNCKIYSDYGVASNEHTDFHIFDAFPNAYLTDTWNWEIINVKTDTPASCFMRAPGSFEAIACIESIMEHIAYCIKQDPLKVKQINFDKPQYPEMLELFDEFQTWADIKTRKVAIEKFNVENRWRKRGLAMIPMAWKLQIKGEFSCLVSIYHLDGSVAIMHGGIELGQGINTKVAQVCAYTLNIPMDLIQVKTSSNINAANNWYTGNSQTSESICYAVIQTCEKLLERMQPVRDKMNNPTWAELVEECYKQKILLMDVAGAFPNSPGIGTYYVYAVCAAEVELDVLTGQHQVSRVDLLQDPGQSMNPLIDIGQVEGAFIMGLGTHTLENFVLSEEGEVLTNSTWTYHVPLATDIPVDFRVQLSNKYPNTVGVLHSKAIGEPSVCLGITVPLALRNAVASARNDSDLNLPSWYSIDGCSTVENIFMNCGNQFKQYTL